MQKRIKTIIMMAIMGMLMRVSPLGATVTYKAIYPLGEADAGATPAQAGNVQTNDVVGEVHLSRVGDPTYSSDSQSSLSMVFDGDDYYTTSTVPSEATDNCGMAAWVKPSSVDSFNFVLSNGSQGNRGWGLLQISGQWRIIHMGISAGSESNVPVDLNEWAHVALVRQDGTSTLYVNFSETDATITADPDAPSNSFTLGANQLSTSSFEGCFKGLIDEVLAFEFESGGFEATDLMWNSVGTLAASDPEPANGATDVLSDTTTSWSAGTYAATHDVYLGTSFADVNDATRGNPLDVLVSEDHEASSYAPEVPLKYGQIYYWRVDEVNGTPDSTIFKGEVWSFTVEPLAYTMEFDSITATASSVKSAAEEPENVIDGSGLDNDLHSVAVADMWRTKSGDTDPWILFAFSEPFELDRMLVWNHNSETESDLGIGIRDAKVEYSVDGANWTTLGTVEFAQATGQADYAANTTVALDGAVAQYVKVTPINNWGGILTQYGLGEVRFLYIPVRARAPEPTDGAAEVSVDSDLTWRGGREAVTHNVYWGTDPEALTLLAGVAEPGYDLDLLNLDTTYYWRIDEVNEAEAVGLWAGDAWSFTTQEFLVVDDFEDYTSNMEDAETIFQSWLDGLESTTLYGGSQVGYMDPPYVERSIVHSGSQSMPLYYDNMSATFSETTLSLSGDWTTSGIKSLSLWFHGAAGNTGQLYVKINGAKVLYDGDTDDIAAKGWLPWNIDLSTVGVDVSKVKTLTIGIEGAGSSGLVHIDDIRLYARTPEYSTPVEPDAVNLVACYALDGNAKDSSGHGHDGQANGDPTYEEGVVGQALRTDGVNDFIDLGKPSDWPTGTSPRSLSVWLLTSSIATGYRAPVAYGTAGGGQALCIAQDGTTLYGSGYGSDLSVSDFWEVDVWYHVCLTYDGTTARLYANGIELASGERAWNLVLSVARIGQQINDSFEFWVGKIDEVRLYNCVLTAEEIAWLAHRTGSMPKAF